MSEVHVILCRESGASHTAVMGVAISEEGALKIALDTALDWMNQAGLSEREARDILTEYGGDLVTARSVVDAFEEWGAAFDGDIDLPFMSYTVETVQP